MKTETFFKRLKNFLSKRDSKKTIGLFCAECSTLFETRRNKRQTLCSRCDAENSLDYFYDFEN